MSNLLAARFADVPVMVGADRANWMTDCLRAAGAEVERLNERASSEQAAMIDDFWFEADDWRSSYRPYKVDASGTLLIPVKGMLLHDFGWAVGDYATGYTYVERAFNRGMADPSVQRIGFMIDSGGGEVAGNFDMVDRMYAQRGQKPVAAFVNEHAYSAAFSIASVADKVYVARTGGVGSVGVVTSHVDASGLMEKMGYKITFIYAGEHKIDGNPYAPLPEAVKNRMQARIDGLYSIFVSTVARNLGVEEQAVRDTEALTYSAEEAVSMGFAHEVRSFDEALAAFSGSRIQPAGEVTMSEANQTPEAIQAGLDAARAEGRKEGAQAERERIQGILGSDEAKSRGGLALHISMNTELPVEAARSVLSASPEEAKPEAAAPAAAGADFRAAMANDNPNLAAEGGENATQLSAAEQLVKDYKAATGYGSN